MLIVILILWLWLNKHLIRCKLIDKSYGYNNPKRSHFVSTPQIKSYRNKKKPQWVVNKVLYLRAISNNGCGKVAETFNRLYGDRETVSKSFVYDKVKKHHYKLKIIKRQIRSKPPRQVAINSTWGIDLTTVTLDKKQRLVLGIIDHGSRLNLKLSEIKTKHSAQILLQLTQAIRQFGFPKYIRTDNETCFNSKFINVALKLLGIKKQTSDIAAPWQNGRIERFFGTFKQKIKSVALNDNGLQAELDIFNLNSV